MDQTIYLNLKMFKMRWVNNFKNYWNIDRYTIVRISRSLQSKLHAFLFIFSISYLILNFISNDTVPIVDTFKADELELVSQSNSEDVEIDIMNENKIDSRLFSYAHFNNYDEDCFEAYLYIIQNINLEKKDDEKFHTNKIVNIQIISDFVSSDILLNNYYLKWNNVVYVFTKVGNMTDAGYYFKSLDKIPFSWIKARAPGTCHISIMPQVHLFKG